MPNRLMHTGSRPALLAAVVTAALSLGTGAQVAAAETAPDPSTGAMNLVLDSSGSMAEPAAGGTTKIEAARTALRQVITGLPDGSRVGMRVYGATVDAGPRACADSQSVVPVGALDRAALTAAVARYTPRGETPIGFALREAAKDLPREGPRTIVLVSDGEANCAPEPCVVAKELAAAGIDMRIDVVGLRLSGAARRQMQCIADAGRGTYYDAADAQSIVSSISRLSLRGVRPFSVSGKPVKGMDTPEVAPDIGPGQYTDTLGGRGDTKYYRIPRSAGSVIHAAVTARPPRYDGSDGLSIELETPEGGRCGSENQTRYDVLGQHSIMSVTVRQQTGSSYDQCLEGDALILKIVRGLRGTNFAPKEDSVPIELLVLEEPRVLNEAELPLPVDDAEDARVPAPLPRGTGKPVAGGASFSDAATLTDGVFSDTIQAGETLFYRVRAEHGQAPAVTMTLQRNPQLEGLTGSPGSLVDITAYAPNRAEIPVSTDRRDRVGHNAFYRWEESTTVSSALPPVRYRNRQKSSDSIGHVSLGGWYYFALQAAKRDSDANWQTTTLISVQVSGEPAGAPQYGEGAKPVDDPLASPLPSDGASEASPETAPEGTTSPTDKPAEESDRTEKASADRDGGSSALPWIVVGGALLASGIGGAAATILRRRPRG